MKPIYIINGPNLNMLGLRQPEIYGSDTLDDVKTECENLASEMNASVVFLQSNYEGQIVEWIQEAREKASAIVINPAAYSHTSVAIFDALNAFDGLVYEVHISNIHAREEFRHHSFVSARAEGVIAGFGVMGYELALRKVIAQLNAS